MSIGHPIRILLEQYICLTNSQVKRTITEMIKHYLEMKAGNLLTENEDHESGRISNCRNHVLQQLSKS